MHPSIPENRRQRKKSECETESESEEIDVINRFSRLRRHICFLSLTFILFTGEFVDNDEHLCEKKQDLVRSCIK